MFFIYCLQRVGLPAALVTLAVASIEVRRPGWLDRLVLYYKSNFYRDVNQVAPVKIDVTIEEAPHDYVDSNLWTFDSVMQLLVLIHESESARPVRRHLRRVMAPTRRFMSRQKSFKAFPSLMKLYRNEFYYDVGESEEFTEPPPFAGVPDDNAVIMVSNPVEARLPSARISVRLLREILDARASAARYMSTTTGTTFSWRPMSRTPTPDISVSGGAAEDGGKGDEAGKKSNSSTTTTSTPTSGPAGQGDPAPDAEPVGPGDKAEDSEANGLDPNEEPPSSLSTPTPTEPTGAPTGQ